MAREDAGSSSDDPGPIQTGSVAKGAGGVMFNIGQINSGNIVIGQQHAEPVLNQALSVLQEFMRVLARHEIADSAEIREVAAVLQAELTSPHPRLPVVRGLLQEIIRRVVSIGELAQLILNIQAIIIHYEAASDDDQNKQ